MLIGLFFFLFSFVFAQHTSLKKNSRETILKHHHEMFHVEQSISQDRAVSLSPFPLNIVLSKPIWKMNYNHSLRVSIIKDVVNNIPTLVLEDAHTHKRFSLNGVFQVTQLEKNPWPTATTVAFIALENDGLYYHYVLDVHSLVVTRVSLSEQQETSPLKVLDEILLD